MKKVLNFLLSPETTLMLLLVFATAIGSATFIEEKYDTVTAKLMVYNAWWFELVLFLLAVNFIGNIKRYRLLRKEKLSNLTFHLAFILMIIGAGITRYISFEGNMHIREGEVSEVMFTADPYIQVRAEGEGFSHFSDRQVWLSPGRRTRFHDAFEVPGKGTVKVSLKEYMSNAVSKIDENAEGGRNILQMVIAAGRGRETLLLEEGESRTVGQDIFTYGTEDRPGAIRFTDDGEQVIVHSSVPLTETMMHGQGAGTDSAGMEPKSDTVLTLTPGNLYSIGNTLILFVRRFDKARQALVQGGAEDNGTPMLLMNVEAGGKSREVAVSAFPDQQAEWVPADIDGIRLSLAYGSKEIQLPFGIRLNDFILDRYAGSMSPSSYASEVTLIDSINRVDRNYRIYMNHVLDYQGYRFFQSSYDKDEKGTILSVNHDMWGTWVSYTGYILLALGFVITLFGKGSRFRYLGSTIAKIREERKAGMALTILLLLITATPSFAQSPPRKAVSEDYADRFGHLLVQTWDGRFEPVQTLANDVMHKISRKDKFTTDVKGEMNDVQVFLDMLLDPEYWRQQKVIYIREKSVRDVLGVEGAYASFYDFIDNGATYKLGRYAEEAFRKRPAEQNTFDKEVIRVDERVNVWMSVLNGSLLKILPLQGSPNHRWVSISDTMAATPLTGDLAAMNADLGLDPLTDANILRLFFTSVYDDISTGDYTTADKLLDRIGKIQRTATPQELLPSTAMVNLEIWYNNARIFPTLKNWYGLLSVLLLILAFADNLKRKTSRALSWALWIVVGLLGAAFLYHTFGLGVRWYLTGHAPWSNGYEALLIIAWGSLLAGFSFMRNSKITLAATALLAFSVLMTAGHSSYDPQLTNLQPVLKSYWLVIHVAVITVSYGFLSLGFILGLINLFIILFRNKKNAFRLDLIVRELTSTNEMSLLVGIVLATIGTFLGGVWANESWGRYWGWDAKETWALVIVITYAFILHMRFIPSLRKPVVFNAASVAGFGSVIMTFVGVNYYLSKGLHSYAADEKTVFPLWGWGMILSVILLIVAAFIKDRINTSGGDPAAKGR